MTFLEHMRQTLLEGLKVEEEGGQSWAFAVALEAQGMVTIAHQPVNELGINMHSTVLCEGFLRRVAQYGQLAGSLWSVLSGTHSIIIWAAGTTHCTVDDSHAQRRSALGNHRQVNSAVKQGTWQTNR